MSQNMDNRIRTAEAMDLLPDDFQNWSEYKDAIEKYDGEVLRILLALIPDPENDANDDYSVLVWAREKLDKVQWLMFCSVLWDLFQAVQGTTIEQSRTLGFYIKGDYFRAALPHIHKNPGFCRG